MKEYKIVYCGGEGEIVEKKSKHSLIMYEDKTLYDARVKSLKPRCACTKVVLWLNDPPRYEHKSGA